MYQTSNLSFKSRNLTKRQNSSQISPNKPFKRKSSLYRDKKDNIKQDINLLQQNKYKRPNSIYYGNTSKQQSFTYTDKLLTNSNDQQSYSYSQKRLKKSTTSHSNSLNNNIFKTNNNNSFIQKKKSDYQIQLLNKQIDKLKKDIHFKQQQIKQLNINKVQFKQIQMELIETYRVINYQQGKLKEQEKFILYHQANYEINEKYINNQIKQSVDFKEIIQFFRKQSIQLKGQVQKTNYQLIKSSNKIRQLENKCFKLQKQVNNHKKQIKQNTQTDKISNNQSKKGMKKRINSIYNTRLQGYKQKIGARNTDEQLSVSSSVRSRSLKSGYRTQLKGLYSPRNNDYQNEKVQISKIYGNFNSKLNKIQKQLNFFKIQTDKIQNQLNQKIKVNGQLILENDQLRSLLNLNIPLDENEIKSFNKKNEDVLNKVTIFKKTSLLKRQQSMTTTQSKRTQSFGFNTFNKKNQEIKGFKIDQINQKIDNQLNKMYKFKQIKPSTLRKIRYNLIREDITYTKLIEQLINSLTKNDPQQFRQTFNQLPYNLSNQECNQFILQHKKILSFIRQKYGKQISNNAIETQNEKFSKILHENILAFKNITIRRDSSLSSQISKVKIFQQLAQTFKNRLDQLQGYLADPNSHEMQFENVQKIFSQKWFLSQQQIDFIFLKSCEETQMYDYFNFPKTINFFLQN